MQQVAIEKGQGIASGGKCPERISVLARASRSRPISVSPSSRGWRLPWKRMKRRLQMQKLSTLSAE
jgi:hypothetical protein